MGDSSSLFGGMWLGQASTEFLSSAFNTEASSSPAGEDVFVPLQVSPTPMGNSEADDLNDSEESPAQFVSIRFMSPTGMRTCRVPWHRGMTVSSALRDAGRRDSVFRLQPGSWVPGSGIGAASYESPSGPPRSWMRSARVVGSQRVRMNYPLKPGDLLKLNPTSKPFL